MMRLQVQCRPSQRRQTLPYANLPVIVRLGIMTNQTCHTSIQASTGLNINRSLNLADMPRSSDEGQSRRAEYVGPTALLRWGRSWGNVRRAHPSSERRRRN